MELERSWHFTRCRVTLSLFPYHRNILPFGICNVGLGRDFGKIYLPPEIVIYTQIDDLKDDLMNSLFYKYTIIFISTLLL